MKKLFKILLWTIGSVLFLIIGVAIFLQTPPGKRVVKNIVVDYLEDKFQTPVSIGEINYRLPSMVSLSKVIFVDKNADTLLSFNYLGVDIAMLQLLNNKLKIHSLDLEGLYANMHRPTTDSQFNYEFIIDAFASANVDTIASKEEDTSATAMLYDINKVRLKDITFIFNDEAGGVYFDVILDSLLLRPKEIDPSKMIYRVEDLIVYKADAQFNSFPATLLTPDDTSSSSSSLILEAQNLQLIQSAYTMNTAADSFYLDLNVGKLSGSLDLFDLASKKILLNGLDLSNTLTTITMGKTQQKPEEPASTDSDTSAGWFITSNKVNLSEIYFKMDDNNAARLHSGIDYSHLDVKQLSLIMDDFLFKKDTIAGDLTHLAMKEKSGLDLRELRTDFVYHDKGASLKNFYLLTPETTLQDNIEVKYTSIDAITKDIGQLFINVNLANSKIGMNDVLIFTPPAAQKDLVTYRNQTMNISGNIQGYVNDLFLKDIDISGLGDLAVKLSGSMKGLPDPNRLAYDFNIENINASYADIQAFVPKSVTDNVRIPQQFAVKGTVNGTTSVFHPDLNITTSDGNVTAKGFVDMNKTGAEQYDLIFQTDQLNIGKILKQDTLLGIVTMTGKAKGTSFDIKKMNATITGEIQRFDFKGYAYHNMYLNADIVHQFANLELLSKDQNAQLDLYAQVDLSNEYPAVVSTIKVRTVDLQALGFVEEQFVLGGDIAINFTDLNPNRPVGAISWKEPIINYDGKIVDVDSFYFSSQPTDSSQHVIAFIPDFLNAEMTGNIPLTQIGTVALSHINEYFSLSDTLESVPDHYNMQLNVGLQYHPTIATFLPELKPFDTIGLTTVMSPLAFNVSAIAPQLTYGTHNIYNLKLNVNDDEQEILNYGLTLDEYNQTDGITVYTPSIVGYLKDDSLYTNLLTHNAAGVENYQASLSAFTQDNVYYAKLLGSLKLNYENWNVSDNLLAYSDSGFYINNLGISKGSESILINSKTPSLFGSPLNIKLQKFDLANVSKILNPDSLLAEGIMDANFDLDLSDSFPRFTGNLGVQNLAFYSTDIGDLKATASNLNANSYNIDANVFKNGNDITLAGLYHIAPVSGNNFDLKLDIGALNLKRFEGLSFGSIRDSDGFLKGNLGIKGTFDKPKINGELITDNLQTRITMINSIFKMPAERITFKDGVIRFEDFKIIDSFGHIATLSGTAETKNYKSYDLNLNFDADKWMATNSTKMHYENMYGRSFISSNLKITGLATAPSIAGNLTVHDSTNFTYANVDNGPGIVEGEGIVKFVDDIQDYRYQKDTLVEDEIANQMTMNINIETEKHAVFNVMVDPLTGDNASVRGAAFLNASMQPGGGVSLTGNYQIAGGYYELFIELVRKKFEITDNSYISLAGDPMEAELNLEAVYEANIAPYDLMEKTASPEDLVYYKQRLPFEIILRITGKPLKPNIRFEIVLPEGKTNTIDDNIANNIQNKLRTLQNDAAELNKQVFGVLAFNRFISEDPIQSGSSGSSMEYFARQSASRFLSQQLNNLASKYVNGLDLSLDVQSQEDYTSGQRENRTSVSLNAQKQFFNDRLTVNVGNDFQVEGRQVPGRDNALIPGNLSIDYKLTPTGKYSIRGYRKNEIQNVIDGYVVETGVGLRLNYEYNRFAELFMNKEQLRAYYRKRRAKREAEEKKEAAKQSTEKQAEKQEVAIK